MKKIMVIGVSAGVGKSTLAKKMADELKIDVYHLDQLYWRAGWVEAPFEEFSEAQAKIVNRESWIIEGNYTSTFRIRSDKADTIVYIEHPIYVCFYRVVKRWLTNLGKTRQDMAEGCSEKLDWQFIKFIATTYYPRKKAMAKRLEAFKNAGKRVYILSSKEQVNNFIQSLNKQTVH
ncbi:topology modulation protein [Anaerobacillus alkaliphilus]|uniref:Topology modulation protein n=1 Tax=Anaerobacillus alkaliphilus TaxID=1548597 RepID=A0A4Q0VU47_9BACI|nr:topology modulation protein [Anaerobacillus alkaliphilus]RXJ02031.1 topology modulation protein [Anaerobacillus alkaliphilus]